MIRDNPQSSKYFHWQSFEIDDPIAGGKGIITECLINKDIESYQQLPSTLLFKSINDDIYKFLVKNYSNLDTSSNQEDAEQKKHEFALNKIQEYTKAYIDLKLEFKHQIEHLSLVFWRSYYNKTPVVFLNESLLPPYQLLFKSFLESEQYPIDPIDYLGVFTALALLVDAQVDAKTAEQDAYLLALGHSISQKLLNKVNTYEIAKEIQSYQFKRRSEPTRVFRRQFILSHATLADSSNRR